jgi:hypothetical protein
MANQPFYSTREGDQLTWFTNLQSRIGTYCTLLDTSPHPTTPTKWTHKAIYRVGDHQVGQWSGEVSVIVGR